MAGRTRRFVFLLLQEHRMYLLEVRKPLLCAVSAVGHGKQQESSRLKSSSLVACILQVMFLRENKKINEF